MRSQVPQLTEAHITGVGREGTASAKLWAGYGTEPGGRVDSHLELHIAEDDLGELAVVRLRRQAAIELRDLLTKFIKQTTQ